MMETALDFLSSLLDEVALEGLDGITLPMLWERLKNRPNFPIALDDDSKIFLWECIAVHKDVEIYELPEPRIFAPIYNRYDHVDNELGIILESAEKIRDSYPIHFVKDGDVRGSCSTYESRKCVTSDIRYDDVLLMSLNQVVERWGERLVLVASPKARLLALIGTETNPLIEMSQEEYCLLERVGRSRYLGEVTQGEGGLNALKAPFCKQLHYYRKKLTTKGLLVKQLHYMKNLKGIEITGSLFQLTRFYVPRKTRMEQLIKCICDALKKKPQKRELCKVIRQELGIRDSTFKKLIHRSFQIWMKMYAIPYKEFNPDASHKESFTNMGLDRIVKVVELVRPYPDSEQDEENEEISNDKEAILPLNVHLDPSKIYFDMPLLTQIYMHIKQAGPEGISSSDLGRIMTLPRLDIRTLLRSLIKREEIVTVLQDHGRQKITKYISKLYETENEAYSKVKEQEQLNKESMAPEKQLESTKRKNEIFGNIESSIPKKKVRFDDNVKEVVFERNENISIPVEAINKIGNTNKINCENIKAQITETLTGKFPKLISFSEKPLNQKPLSLSNQLTYRKLKRSNMIIDYLKQIRFSTMADLQKYLIEKEKEEGYNFKLDKKSTIRLVYNLYNSKKIKIYKAVLKLENEKTEIEFICDISLTASDPCIRVAIEQAKFKYFTSKDKSNKNDNQNKSELINAEGKFDSCDEKEMTENKTHKQPIYKVIYHVQPKFVRVKTLHMFLHYLAYSYDGTPQNNGQEPIIYHDSVSWKRYVPPLPNYGKEGWCFMADVFERMPLSIFIRIVNLRHEIHNLKECLENEEKKHYLLKHLPKLMRSNLLSNRKYILSTDDVLKGLCYFGLITLGPQISKPKDQMFIFVHRNAKIKDTTISTTGYLHVDKNINYDIKEYTFNTLNDVETFWIDLERISLHTPLGKYSSMAGKTIAITEAHYKPELMKSLLHKNFDEISDIEHVPGDGLGAGGFDSSLFLHCRRNWQSSNSIKLSEQLKSNTNISNANVSSIQHLLQSKDVKGVDSRKRLQRLSKNCMLSKKGTKILQEKKTNVNENEKSQKLIRNYNRKERKTKYRTVLLRKRKQRTPYYDEKDKAAIEKMDKSRCEWSAQEDSFLLLCKVTSSFLDHASRALVVPFTVVRDLLHEHLPELSANKSSRACQRRLRYMMMNSTTTNNVAVFLGEAKQDVNLVKEFERTKPPKTKEEVWKSMFTSVLKRLLQKFILPASDRCKCITLPNTLTELNEKFEIMSPRIFLKKQHYQRNPENEDEIKYFTLYSLILSAMALDKCGIKWIYLLHKLYQVYPESLLKSVVERLRSERIIAAKRKTNKDLKHCLATTFPYRFSMSYENALLTKFPIKLFSESQELLKNLEKANSDVTFELKEDIPPGYTAAIFSLAALEKLDLATKIPEQIILFDTTLSKEVKTTIVQRMSHTLTDKESDELTRLLSNETDVSNEISRSKTVDDDNTLTNSEINISQMNDICRSSNASRFALYLLRQELSQPPIERVQHSQDYIVLNSCRIFCQLKSDRGKENFPLSSTNNISESFMCQENDITFTQKYETLTYDCISQVLSSIASYISPDVVHHHRYCKEYLKHIYETYSDSTLQDAESIFNYVLKCNVTGASEKELWETFNKLTGELSYFQHLELLCSSSLIIRAGVTCFVYVYIGYAKSWVLKSYLLPKNYKTDCKKSTEVQNDEQVEKGSNDTDDKRKHLKKVNCIACSAHTSDSECDFSVPSELLNAEFNDEENMKCVYYIPRTWRYPDGTLNKKVFIDLLSTVLSYIISTPGITTNRVCERFSSIMQPVQTLELLEILEKLNCICKYYCKSHKNQNLFTTFSKVYITENPEPSDIDHLESVPDAVCKLAQIRETLQNI